MELESIFVQAETAWSSRKYIDGPKTCTYRDLANHSKRLAALFQSSGISPGDRIAIASVDDIEVASIFLSSLRYHLSVVILDPASKSNEVLENLGAANTRAIFADHELIDRWSLKNNFPAIRLWSIAKKKKKLISRLLGNSSQNDFASEMNYPECLEKFFKFEFQAPGPSAPEPALLLCTSGTTGRPKIPRLSLFNMAAAAAVEIKQMRFSREVRMMDLLPVNHYDGVVSGLITAFFGGFTLVRLGQFTVPMLPDILDSIYKYRVTHLQLTPSILSLMLRLGENLETSFNTEDFQFIISVAAALPAKLWSDFEERSKKRVVNAYGLTETGNYLFAGPDDVSHQIGSVGKPVDCKVTVVDDSGAPVPAGVEGEVLMNTDSVIDLYLDQTVEKVSLSGGEYFATGDLGYVDQSGIYWLVGRKKNIIIVGGRNVYPDEVNSALLSHPSVAEAATVGVPDSIWGERVVSAVVLQSSISTQKLTQYISERLTDYKAPREIHILPELPRGRSGKVQLKTLAEQLSKQETPNDFFSDDHLQETIFALASESFRVPVSEISISTTPQTCNRWDSVAHMDFVVNLETHFRVELLPREITQMASIGAAVKIISEKLQS